jgi:hypothetical protein
LGGLVALVYQWNDSHNMFCIVYVTCDGCFEMWSHKTSGHYIQVYFIWNALWRKMKVT